ncbi:MAG TPA: hypothetical protein VGY54_04010, partial [Polyangiaceae bacterium]|nr:hypothetical protein [Polyangiaceae bacterium]
MRKRLAVAALLIGAGVAAAFAAISLRVTMTGSSELFNVTSQVLATCRGTSGITSSGTTSDSAESNLIAGSQTIAPMTRLLGPAACGANQSKAEGLVVGLDALGILGSLSSAGTAACNGTDTTDCNAEAVGMAYSTTVTTTPNHFPSYQYTFHDWRDVLGMIYGGRSNGQSSQPNDAGCNSDIRNTLANTWGNIFQKGGTCQSSSPDGCTQLQHAFRLDDGSEVSNVFAQLLGLSPTPNQAANYAFGASPFCNVNSVGVKVATATNPITITTLLAHGLSTGQVVSVVGVGVNRDMSQITGPTQSTTGNQAAIGQWTVTKIDATSFTLNNSDGTIAGNGSAVGNFAMVLLPPPPGLLADYVPTSYRELDPVRRPCANNGGPTLNLEDVCGRDNQLGLVLPIVSTDFIAGGVPAQYPSTPCGGGSNFSVRTATLVDPTSGVPVLANCPNGDTPHGGNLCVIPATGGTNPQCLAGPSDKPFVYNTNTGLSPAPGQVLGTVFNSWLLLPNRTFQHDKFGNPIIGAWYRIHQSDTLAGSGASIAGGANVNGGLGPVPAAPGFCQRPDAASQIGCLVQASPCSLGLGRSAAVNWNAPNAPNTVALKINQRLPLSQCLQTVSYPLWRKVYLNSLTGFSGASNQELAFSQCEGTASTLNAALTASGFAPLPTTAPNAGTAYCEDFNEQTLCNASANVNACATNSGTGLAYASTATTICGNGAIEAFEDCDNGLANGPVPAECSTTCRFNGVPPPPGSAPSWSSPTLTVQQATSTSVTLTVTGAPSGAAKYQIFVNGNPYALVTGSGPFTVSGLSVGTSYAFGVQASDATGLSSTNGPTQNFTDTFTCSGQANGTACTPASPAKCVTYSCQNNSCVAAPIAVDDGNQCTLDTCDPVTGVVSHHACSPIDMTVATNVTQVTQFLYAGPNPVQTGADAGALPPATSGVVRGHVYQSNLASDGGAPTPLMGVTVTVLNHPEFGSTLTHGDGMFDMAVAGGQTVRLNFALAGYLPAQRTVQVPWQNYVLANDVVLMPPDPVKNLVDLTQSAPQVVRGSPQSDVDSDGGTRTATAVIFPGTQATMTLPDGGTQTITNLTIHATEHTNKTGMTNTDVTSAMPGDLPPTSAFTYAVDLSAEEAIDAGATALTFTEAGTDAGSPVSFYVENFLNFPVGTALPVGFYDKTQGTWVPSSVPTNNGNGVVFQIVSITGTPPTANLATVDAGAADPPSTLQSNFGITPAEQQQIAALYDAGAGKTYWRAQIPHFSGVDINLGWGPPPNATGPTPPGDPTGGSGGAGGGPGPCRQNGSIIDCQDQVLGERLPIAGTPYSLAYESDRQRGRLSQLSIPISGATLPDPADLVGLEASVFVAGRLFAQNWFPPQTNLTWNFTWDGTDAYGRFVQGAQPAFVRVGAVYQGVYEKTGRFGFSANGTPISTASTSPIRQLVTIWKYWWGTLGNGTPGGIGVWDSEPEGFGGWTLNVHHRFDIGAKALRFGDGTNLTPAFEPGV